MQARKLIILHLSVILAGCTGSDSSYTVKKFGTPEPDFSIWADEYSGTVACHFLFKGSNKQQRGVFIPKPGKLELDGEELKADSTKFSGFFYDYNTGILQFSGKHFLLFTDPSEKIYKKEFKFSPVSLALPMEEIIKRKPFTVIFNNMAGTIYVRLVLTDTSFYSKDFNDMVPVVNGKMEISRKMLDNVKNGPVTLEIFMEKEEMLFDHSPYGGRILITYHMQRELELAD